MKKIFAVLFIILNLIGLNQKLNAKGSTDKDLSPEYFAIAEAYTELKKYDKAIDYYKRAEKSKSYGRAANYNLAQVYALKKDWPNCIKYLKPLHEQAPKNIKISSAYAYALASNKQEAKALELYKSVYEDSPETPEYFFNYTRLLIVVKKYDEAKKMLEDAKKKFKKDEENKTINELEKTLNDILKPKEKKDTEKKKQDNKKEKQDKKDKK